MFTVPHSFSFSDSPAGMDKESMSNQRFCCGWLEQKCLWSCRVLAPWRTANVTGFPGDRPCSVPNASITGDWILASKQGHRACGVGPCFLILAFLRVLWDAASL